MIVPLLVRIDSRLIHGQIIEGWAPHLKLKSIVVADDYVASDPMQKTIMRMAVPSEISVTIGSVKKIVEKINQGAWFGRQTLVLFSDILSVRRAVDCGLKILLLNIGNIHHAPDRVQITPSVALNRNDLSYLRQLERQGIQVEIRALPRQNPISLNQVELP